MKTEPYDIKIFKEHQYRELFAFRNENLLIYWPHGLGDWVFLGFILNHADKSNNYFVTRFGDDYVSILDGAAENIHPIYITEGINHSHGADQGIPNFNFYENKTIIFPKNLASICKENSIRYGAYGFSETFGYSAFPFHTKARNQLRNFMDENDPALKKPLHNCISLEIPNFFEKKLDAIMENELDISRKRKLCLINRTGHTLIEKNWGYSFREETKTGREAEEPRGFIKNLKAHDDKWYFISFEDRALEGDHSLKSKEYDSFSYFEIFKNKRIPFSFVLKYLLKRCELFVGVPSGPYEVSLLFDNYPNIAIWLNCFPSWYDEPKNDCTYIMGKDVFNRRLDELHGSFLQREGIVFNHVLSPKRIVDEQLTMDVFKTYYD